MNKIGDNSDQSIDDGQLLGKGKRKYKKKSTADRKIG